MVERGAVLVVAFEVGLNVGPRPNDRRRIQWREGRVHSQRVKAIQKHLAATRGGIHRDFLFADESGGPGIEAVVVQPSCHQRGGAVGGRVVKCRAPAAIARTQVRVAGVEQGGATRADGASNVAAVQPGQRGIHAQARRFDGRHGGHKLQALGKQFVAQLGLLRRELACRGP